MAERKIICGYKNREGNPDETCTGVIAHQISPRMMQIGRGDQRFSLIINGDGQATATCPKCGRIHSFIWKDGALRESELQYEDITPAPGGNPDDPNDPNNPDQNPGGVTPPVDPPTPPAEA